MKFTIYISKEQADELLKSVDNRANFLRTHTKKTTHIDALCTQIHGAYQLMIESMPQVPRADAKSR